MVFFHATSTARRSVSLASEMRLLMTYFAAFDGQQRDNAWQDRVQAIANATFHDDLVVVEGSQQFNKQQFMAKLQNFVQEGGFIQVHALKQRQGLGISYEISFHKPGSSAATTASYPTKSFATFQDGKLIRVQRQHVRKANAIL